MAKQFGSQLDLQKIPVLNLVAEQKASPGPLSPVVGQLWWDTSTSTLKVCVNATGPVWTQCDNASVGGTLTIQDENVQIATAVPQLDFQGAGVTATSGSGEVIVTIPGYTAGAGLALTTNTFSIAAGAVTSNMIQDNEITATDINSTYKDGATGTASLRTLGSGAQQALAGNTPLNSIAVPTGSVSLNSQRITNLLVDGSTASTDAVTKGYVDTVAQGLDPKQSCRAATTGNLTGALGGAAPNVLDGVTLAANDRVLVKDQSSQAVNGVYIVNTVGTGINGSWARAADMDAWTEVPSAFVFIEEGTVNADTGWVCTANTGGTLNTTAITWAQFSGQGSVVAGNGLVSAAGNTINAQGTGGRISVTADNIDIDSTYVGQATITTLGTIATGTWNATTIALNKGGTGATTAAGARTAIGAPGKFTGNCPALTAGIENTVTHNLGTKDIVASVQNTSDFEVVVQWRAVDTNTIGITTDVGYTASALRVTVVG